MNEEIFSSRRLEAFAAVVEAGTITLAARRLGRSQSVVTRLVQDLEEAIQFDLLHRAGPKVTPTERGILFYEEVEQLLQSLRHTEASARAIAQSSLRPLEIAATPALSVSLIPRAMARVEPSLLPDDVHINTVNAERVVQEVVSRTADLGVSSYPFEGSGIDVQWVGDAPCVAMVRHDNPLATSAVVSLRDLHGQRLLTLSVRLRARIDEALAAQDVKPASVFQSGTSSAVLAMAREGLGLAVIDPATAYGLPLDGLVAKPLDHAIPFVIGGFSRAGRPLSASALALNNAIISQAATMLPGFRFRSISGIAKSEGQT